MLDKITDGHEERALLLAEDAADLFLRLRRPLGVLVVPRSRVGFNGPRVSQLDEHFLLALIAGHLCHTSDSVGVAGSETLIILKNATAYYMIALDSLVDYLSHGGLVVLRREVHG